MVKRIQFCRTAVLFTLIILSLNGFSQNVRLSGQVRDAATKELMIGVTIVVTGQNVGVVSDATGKFSIQVKPGSELSFSYVGYKDQSLKVTKAQTSIDIEMTEDGELIDEVLVVGYGQQKKASSVGAITQTDGASLMKTASGVTSVAEALQGMLPGVISINTNSMPGEDQASIMIRGKGTWQSSDPLVLVDGVERDMNNVDMNEIDKVSVLKDASATAVYGVRGANGVILITTKSGVLAKPTISFSANLGFKQMTSTQEWADPITTMEMYNEASRNDGLWNNLISESVIEAWRKNIGNAGPYNQYFPLVDMWEEIAKPVGYSQNYNVNVSGGTEVMKYFASLGYTNDGDIFDTKKNAQFDPRFYFERYNWRSNFDFTLTKTTNLSVKLSGSMGKQNAPGIKIDGDSWGVSDFYEKIYFAPTFEFPIQYEDGTVGDASDGKGNIKYALNEAGQRMSKSVESFTDVSLRQDLSFITKGLSITGKVAYTLKSSRESNVYNEGGKNAGIDNTPFIREYRKYDITSPIVAPDGSVSYPLLSTIIYPNEDLQEPVILGEYDNFSSDSQKLYYEFSLNYARSFSRHNVSALVLMNRNNIENSQGRSKIAFPAHQESWVGRVTYNWAERYLLEVNAAYNGSEKFAPGKRFGMFPSYSIGWRISEEPFVKEHVGKWLTNLKLRYSYGTVGSDAGAARFNYIQTYNTGNGMKFGEASNIMSTPLYWAGRAADPNATWETAVKQNFGVELTVFSKLNVTFDLFSEKRKGILMSYRTIPLWVGTLNAAGNIGQTQNRGFELEVSYNDRINQNLSYWVKGNFTMNQNRIIYRDDPKNRADYMKEAGKPIGWQGALLTNGYYDSLDDIYNSPYASLGTLPSNLIPGDVSYIDYNADGVIDLLDQAPLEKVNYPMNTGGITLGIKYKGFEVSAMFYGVFNQIKAFNKTLWDYQQGILKAQPNVKSRWTPENALNGSVGKPALHLSYGSHSQDKRSEYVYANANYVRLKSAEISYAISGQFMKTLGISRAQVYASGNNLFTWTKLDKRMDPETNGTSVYPLVRRYNLGIRITF